MADYPASVYSPRTKEDLPGYPYTPANQYIGYSEDITYLENEVLAIIADMVGAGVAGGLKGAYGNLSLRLANYDGMLDQAVKSTSGPTFDHIHLTTPGNGDAIKGPASSTDNAIPRFDLTSGKIIQDSGFSIDDSNNMVIPAAGNLYSVAWANYGSSSTILGFSGGISADILYMKLGRLVFVSFSIYGTSNASNFSFTVPYVNNDIQTRQATGSCYDSGAYVAAGFLSLDNGGTQVNLYRSAAGVWTGSGTKGVQGQFFYKTAS